MRRIRNASQRLRPDDLAGQAQAIRLDEDQLKACRAILKPKV